MKKIAMFLMAAFGALTITSCNSDSNSDYPQGTIFATAQSGSLGLYFVTDQGETLFVDEYMPANYYPSWGDRVVFSYSIVNSGAEADPFDYTIKIYEAVKARWADVQVAATNAEMEAWGEGRLSFQLMQWSKESLNMYAVPNGSSKGNYTLVYNEDPEFKPKHTENGYINFVLCHDTSTDQPSANQNLGEYLSFSLEDFASQIAAEGTKGFILEATTSNGERGYLKIDWPAAN